MNSNSSSDQILKKYELEIGDVLVIDHHEWRIAEVDDNKIILYREGIDGSSRIEELNEAELVAILKEQLR